MVSIAAIEGTIEKLSAPEVAELAGWMETLRAKQATSQPVEGWLKAARGAAIPGQTTAGIMAQTRGEE